MPANLPDLSDFAALRGNLKWSVIVIALAWTLAAFGEEMVGRGYLMNRVAELGKYTRAAWMVSLIAVNAAFGSAPLRPGNYRHDRRRPNGNPAGMDVSRHRLQPLGPSRMA